MEKIALVTGGNRGIGKEVCRQLALEGFTVLMGSRDVQKGKDAAAEMKGTVKVVQLDVDSEASVDALQHYLYDNFSHLDVLVNNAAVVSRKRMSECDAEEMKQVLGTNLLGAIRVTGALLPLLKKSKEGRIINVSSGMGAWNDLNGGYAAYRMSKLALNAFTLMLASEYRSLQMKVNAVCPGWVRTDMGGAGAGRSVEKGAETIVWLATEKHIPSGKFFRDKKEISF